MNGMHFRIFKGKGLFKETVLLSTGQLDFFEKGA
jgi:hypothetical protein